MWLHIAVFPSFHFELRYYGLMVRQQLTFDSKAVIHRKAFNFSFLLPRRVLTSYNRGVSQSYIVLARVENIIRMTYSRHPFWGIIHMILLDLITIE
uniref:Putative ovule protein n=1 Tax=Solanum chacoense TaxID=4108 RepID=A0A0V0GQX9_SOLCH